MDQNYQQRESGTKPNRRTPGKIADFLHRIKHPFVVAVNVLRFQQSFFLFLKEKSDIPGKKRMIAIGLLSMPGSNRFLQILVCFIRHFRPCALLKKGLAQLLQPPIFV
jgi:hypothetical protein